jgi:hypothetical protein
MNQTGARDDARCWPGPGGTRAGIVQCVACTMRTSAGAFRAGGGGPNFGEAPIGAVVVQIRVGGRSAQGPSAPARTRSEDR